jgi:hypothetical protein
MSRDNVKRTGWVGHVIRKKEMRNSYVLNGANTTYNETEF